jgi:hypothetical protein
MVIVRVMGKAEISKRAIVVLVVMSTAGLIANRSAASQSTSGQVCKAEGKLMHMTGLAEASGLAVSRVTPGRLWSHGDSGAPEIVAVDAQGKVAGRVSVPDATLVDWEANAAGPCGSGSCLFIADIGDNAAERKEVAVYRVPEPAMPSGSVRVDAILRASYPDGEHDAEALLAGPDGRLFIVTKGETDDIGLYRFPSELRTDAPMKLERVGKALSKGQPNPSQRITDGAISPDGQRVVLRTKSALIFYRASEFLNGDFKETGRMDLSSLKEPQGEAVAFGSADTVYLAGEGGSREQPGTLAILTCTR